jgi:hypothetical protein
MNTLFIVAIFLIGVTIGAIVHYTRFCVFGAIAE